MPSLSACIHGSAAPCYLQNAICPVAIVEPRLRLRSASSADLIDTTFNHGRLRLHRRRTTSMKQSQRRSPSQFIAGRLQTLFVDSLVYTVFLCMMFYTRRCCDFLRSAPEVTFFTYGTLNISRNIFFGWLVIAKILLLQHNRHFYLLTFRSLSETFIRRSLFNSSSGSCHDSDAT